MPALLAGACLLAYAPTLATKGFIRDDRWLIAENPVLARGWRGWPQLLASGYHETAAGAAATVQEYRPLVMLSYALQRATTGARTWPFHLANVALHAVVCALFWLIAKDKLGPPAAAAASLLYAALAVHAEDVASITSRSELLAAALMLGAWRALDSARRPRLAAGAALFSAALLTKEHALFFPVLLAADDWTTSGRRPWGRDRRAVYAVLGACAAAVAALRVAVLGRLANGGVPYFASGRLVAALTYARFAAVHYLFPSLTGLGLCADFTRPLIPDAAPGTIGAWAWPLAWTALAVAAARALRRRKPWGFWALAPLVFLLPTCHLIVPLDTLGAERFLYMPSLGLCALLGLAFARLARRWRRPARAVMAGLVLWQAAATLARDRVWSSELAYYADAARCNPVSAKARCGLGAALIESGRREAGVAQLSEALRLRPGYAPASYNLALEAWERGDAREAERRAKASVGADPAFADAWILLGVIADRSRRLPEAEADLKRAVALLPWSALARRDLGRVELELRRPEDARSELARFLDLAPEDPDAPAIAALVRQLAGHIP